MEIKTKEQQEMFEAFCDSEDWTCPKEKKRKLSNNSTLSQSVERVDPEGSCKKDNSKAECNCFGSYSEDVIWFFGLKCQCEPAGDSQ